MFPSVFFRISRSFRDNSKLRFLQFKILFLQRVPDQRFFSRDIVQRHPLYIHRKNFSSDLTFELNSFPVSRVQFLKFLIFILISFLCINTAFIYYLFFNKSIYKLLIWSDICKYCTILVYKIYIHLVANLTLISKSIAMNISKWSLFFFFFFNFLSKIDSVIMVQLAYYLTKKRKATVNKGL